MIRMRKSKDVPHQNETYAEVMKTPLMSMCNDVMLILIMILIYVHASVANSSNSYDLCESDQE